jgi:DNA processing protein
VLGNTSHEDRLAWLRLKLTPGLGNRSILRLIRRFGSPVAAVKASRVQLDGISGIQERAKRALARGEVSRPPEREWEDLQAMGAELVCLGDESYPANLKEIADPPAVLFVRGKLEPRDLVAVAVVGSRAASAVGMAFTERLCRELAGYGVTVVSGLAVGIDAAAHRGALNARGRTLGVLGCGLDVGYPQANRTLKENIMASGAVMTEFPLGTPPLAGHFPQRNRIISGLALGVVVVEAAQRSGSLITARAALEQGREVFAVPGTARNRRSAGPHRLLREGAKLVECAEDILEELRPHLVRRGGPDLPASAPTPADTPSGGPCDVTSEETTVLGCLDEQPLQIDQICRRLQWPAARVTALLLSLELKGLVRQLPGKYFVRP